MSSLTSITPACSVVRIRVYGDSGKGPVSTLCKGSVIATFSLFPSNYNPEHHEPVLGGVPDGWTLPNIAEFAANLKSVQKSGAKAKIKAGFVPMVLADDVCVRRKHDNALWTEVHASVLVSGVGELYGRWCDGSGCNSGTPQVMFPNGSEIWCYIDFDGNTLIVKLCAAPDVALARKCQKSVGKGCKPVGEFVHAPLRLSFGAQEQVPSVFVEPLTSKALRQTIKGSTGTTRVIATQAEIRRFADYLFGESVDVVAGETEANYQTYARNAAAKAGTIITATSWLNSSDFTGEINGIENVNYVRGNTDPLMVAVGGFVEKLTDKIGTNNVLTIQPDEARSELIKSSYVSTIEGHGTKFVPKS